MFAPTLFRKVPQMFSVTKRVKFSVVNKKYPSLARCDDDDDDRGDKREGRSRNVDVSKFSEQYFVKKLLFGRSFTSPGRENRIRGEISLVLAYGGALSS